MSKKGAPEKSVRMRLGYAVWMLALFLMLACKPAEPQAEAVPTAEPSASAEVVTVWFTPDPTAAPTLPAPPTPDPTEVPPPDPTGTPTPSQTPVPAPTRITIGAVGDIMDPRGIVSDTHSENDTYDFHTLFAPFADLFGSVDLMCGNLETPLAGKEAGYSAKDNTSSGLLRFNAPDSVLDALKDCGMDLLSTGNNHCLDKGEDGLYRTVETIRAAGFYQTGTFLNAEDRQIPCIVDVQGVRVGFVAATRTMNINPSQLGMNDEHAWTVIDRLAFGKGDPTEGVLEDIRRVRENGAEFVILFAHWDYENDSPTAADTRTLARTLIAAGADCIIGSHPHRVKGAEYITVEREDGPYTGLVLYSLGNFTANNRFELMVGLFAQLTLEKDFAKGTVTLCDAAVLPTLTVRRSVKSGPQFTVLPAYADPENITGIDEPLTKAEIKSLEKARALALKRLGHVEGLRVLDE